MLKPLAAALLLVGSPAFGSSDDAWSAFATEVENACLAAASNALDDASAVVDPFGSESYGLAIVTGRTVNDRAASMICVLNKETRAVQIGGELEIAVLQAWLQPLSANDIENAALAGELFCSFEGEIGTVLLAAGYVASDQPAEAAIKLSNQMTTLSAEGGFNTIVKGTLFTGPGGSAKIELTGDSTEGGESPAHPATLTVQSAIGADLRADGLWRCGP
ncbi:hypothetical protein E4L95_03005 [Paracoccus liaowanqingii]|uniref:Uncharacterized protein n=1 Tax=Paracoccus liaowanqingii TaxID=2560053 RepID=A0A4Z1CRU1_9RHOB|nr:hypothetical protein [Paracoccus liaowanqingii]TGN67981.1 hypothetical protein E4L95_03005 [Paracoccus liaowanqingii]